MAPHCYVTSDLHLFSNRSNAHRHAQALKEVMQRADILILAGDIFDFKWSHFCSASATAEAASEWLVDLAEVNPECALHYVLGNHDHHPALMDRLETLAGERSRFSWHPYHLRIGNAVFLHGDAANVGRGSAERLERFRAKFGEHPPQGRVKNRLYDATVAVGLHVAAAKVAYPERAVVRRLANYLTEAGYGPESGARNVYFGHTHLALDAFEHGGMRYHNGGATIPGLDYRILKADLS